MAPQGDSSQALLSLSEGPSDYRPTRPARYVQGWFQAESRESPIASVLDVELCAMDPGVNDIPQVRLVKICLGLDVRVHELLVVFE